MSRTRMFGTIAAVVACAGFVAGCGGGSGYTAAESAPTPAAPVAAAAAAAPATPGVETAIGSFAQSDPATARDQTFASFQRFPKTRAGKIFVGPAVPVAAATAATSAAIGATANPVTTIPQSPSGSAATSVVPTSSEPTPAPVTTQLSASLQISGRVETVIVGNQVPKSAPQFTVQAITSDSVTLKLNSGTLPGGGTTVELTKGNSVTLSNPSTGASLTIKVVEVKAEL